MTALRENPNVNRMMVQSIDAQTVDLNLTKDILTERSEIRYEKGVSNLGQERHSGLVYDSLD